jgi:hypothetical protein
MSLLTYSLCHVNLIYELEFIQDVLLMVFDTTLSTVRKIGHKIVESWHKAHIMVKIFNFMVA